MCRGTVAHIWTSALGSILTTRVAESFTCMIRIGTGLDRFVVARRPALAMVTVPTLAVAGEAALDLADLVRPWGIQLDIQAQRAPWAHQGRRDSDGTQHFHQQKAILLLRSIREVLRSKHRGINEKAPSRSGA